MKFEIYFVESDSIETYSDVRKWLDKIIIYNSKGYVLKTVGFKSDGMCVIY